MRKLILLIFLITTSLVSAQKLKVDALKYKSVTTTERDAFSVPAGEHWRIWNSTTSQFEYWDGDSWEAVLTSNSLDGYTINSGTSGAGDFDVQISGTAGTYPTILQLDQTAAFGGQITLGVGGALMKMYANPETINFESTGGIVTESRIGISNGSFTGQIFSTNLTALRNYELPNLAGVFALEADASGFDGNLSTTDNTLQEIAQKFDDIVIPVDTNLAIATTVEINTGTVDSKAMSPLGFANSDYASDITANNAKVSSPINLVSNESDLTTLISGSTKGIYLLTSDIALTSGKTIPEGVTIQSKGAKFTGTQTITFSNNYIDANAQIFTGDQTFAGTLLSNIKAEWFGAKVDDTTDDREAVMLALEMADDLSGHTVELLKGEYYIDSRIPTKDYALEVYSNTSLIGQGMYSSTLKVGDNVVSDTPLILTNSASNLEFKDFEIDGNKTRLAEASRGVGEDEGIDIKGGSNVTISNLYIHDCATDAIDIDQVTLVGENAVISNCLIEDNGGVGIHNNFDNCEITNNIVLNNGHERLANNTGQVALDACGIDAKGDYITISNNIINSNAVGINIAGINNPMIVNNTISGNGDYNIVVGSVTATSGPVNTLISNNNIKSSKYGIYVKSSQNLLGLYNNIVHTTGVDAVGFLVEDANQFELIGGSYGSWYSIEIQSVDNLSTISTTFTGSGNQTGVRVLPGASGNLLIRNCIDDITGGTQAIDLRGLVNGIQILNNQFLGRKGVRMLNSGGNPSNAVIKYNYLTDLTVLGTGHVIQFNENYTDEDSAYTDSNGNIYANAFIKDGATSDDILLGDGTTTSLAALSPDAFYVANSNLNANHYARRVLNNGGVFESIDQLFYDLNNITIESLQFTPNAVQADTLYGIEVNDYETGTEGDFVFARTTTATKKNVNGLLEEVAADVPRIDYSNNASGELLLEPSRTNELYRSEDLTSGSWLKVRNSITANAIEAPDGTLTADAFVSTVDDDNHRTQQTKTITASSDYVLSAFVKRGVKDWAYLTLETTSPIATHTVYFDIANGVVGTIGSTIDEAYIEDYGNDWYRIIAVKNNVTGGSQTFMTCFADADLDPTWAGDGSAVDGYVWGIQLEEGLYPTTYIGESLGTSVTRNAETASGAGSTTTINTQEGVLYIEAAALYNDITNRHISLSDGTTSNQIVIGYDNFSNRIEASLFNGGSEDVKLSYVVTDITELHKIAFKWAETDFALWIDGTEVATNTSSSVDAADTYNELQLADGDGGNDFIGRLRELKVFTTALTDAELTALTSKTDYTPKHLARTDVDPYFTKDVTVQGDLNIEGTITQAPKYANQGGATYTLTTANHLYTLFFSSGSAKTVTIPTNATEAIPIGTVIYLINTGAGDLTFNTTGIVLTDDLPNQTIVQNARRTLTKVGDNGWLLSY